MPARPFSRKIPRGSSFSRILTAGLGAAALATLGRTPSGRLLKLAIASGVLPKLLAHPKTRQMVSGLVRQAARQRFGGRAR